MNLFLPWPRPPAPGGIAATAPPGLSGRINWAGPRQKETWAPRLERLARAACAAELSLVETGQVAAAAVLTTEAGLPELLIPPADWPLTAIPVRAIRSEWPAPGEIAGQESGPLICELLVVRRDETGHRLETLDRADPYDTALAFGYPQCCARRWADRLAIGAGDPLGALFDDQAVPESAFWLLAGLGIGPLRHVPCSTSCAATRESMQLFVELCEARDSEAAGWLKQIEKWPADCSVAVGIAEVKTPYFRYTHAAPGSAPGRAAFVPPRSIVASAPAVAAAAAGVSPAAPVIGTGPVAAIAEGWREAGFENEFALRSRYCSLVWHWASELRGGGGTVLHLPCGDGLLMELVAEINPKLALHGLESEPSLLALARHRRDGDRTHVQAVDWTDPDLPGSIGGDGRDGRAVFIDPEILVALPTAQRASLVSALLARFRLVAIYATDRGLHRFGAVEALAEAAGLRLGPASVSGVTAEVVGLA